MGIYPSIGNQMINARAETLLDKRAFNKLVAQRRCLIPADGFYEWRRHGDRKVPVWIHLKGKEPFAFAGLWDSWRNSGADTPLETFTIITTEPNALLRPIHNRMPVIFDTDTGKHWLKQSLESADRLKAVLRPWPAELMEAQDVSNLVNSPDNDSPDCVKPLPADYAQPGQLPLL